MLTAHEGQNNEITLGAAEYSMQIPYGVLETEGRRVVKITEKPRKSWLTICSAYCISPDVLGLIPTNGPFDMPDLIQAVLARNGSVGYFHFADVTRIEDLVPSHRDLWAADE